MSDFRKLAHLWEQLGEDRFNALISSDNTGKVKEFCDELLKNAVPTEMTVGGRTYEILGFLRGDETSVVGHTMVERAVEANANLGENDGQHLLDHQDEIPAILQGKVYFVLTDWRRPDGSGRVAYLCWGGFRWIQCWGWLGSGRWDGYDRVLRRK